MVGSAPGTTVPEQPDERLRPPGRRPWTGLWVPALALPPLVLLAAASWTGRWVRPSADDWCFLPVVRDEGISGIVGTFYLDDNGRVANGLLVGAYARFGVAGHQWFAVVSAVLTLGVLWAVAGAALRRAGLSVPRGTALLLASMATALFLFATTNTYKTFYWPAASVSHTLPPVLACAALIPLLRSRSRRGRLFASVSAFLMGLVIGTLSEETTVVVLVVLVAAALTGRRVFPAHARTYGRAWCAAGIAGTGTGALILLASPGSQARRERFGAQNAALLAPDSLIGSLRGFGEIIATVATTWQYAGAVAAGLLLGLLADRADGTPARPPAHRALLATTGTLALLVSGYLCTVITYPAFAERVAVANRLWNDYLLLYIVLLVGAGLLIGQALRPLARNTVPVKAVCAALCVLVCIGPAIALARLDTNMQARAERWDRQDRWLRERAAAGADAAPYTPVTVSGMLEPFSRQGRSPWPAGCVADYYRLERVTYSTELP
ncbi:DUF6056 family protein [Streptomyces fulvorobeus]|uniref:Uncharacterized protein n=1 Tax=Streptomyces fulvorobeus TaxID=284028 RepID=A0A7J0CF90_9ACTN|nr:DUF6056 family protein [Streptomyces fulvorobeus]NYE44392.1 hypothetical protein [Streptomyces fulvorobeus]GFN00918.1 hypothetical protein Sfulv_57280 [Streptomyces fulvorobeus]